MAPEIRPAQAGNHILDRILEARTPVLVLETGQPEVLVRQIRQRVLHSGQAVYLWKEDAGLCSLREDGVRIPGCLRAGDTLRYVLRSVCFGVYLMAGLEMPLKPSHLSLLQRISRAETPFVRRVVLFSDGPGLGQSLDGIATVLPHYPVAPTRLHLRDGRWVA